MLPQGKIGIDSFARTDTQKTQYTTKHKTQKTQKTAKTVRYAKRKVYAAVEDAKTTRGEHPQKKQGGYRMRAAGVISVCSCVNEEKCQAAEIRWAREQSFRRGKVRQKGENRGKACRLHRKVQEVSLKDQ